MLAPAARALGRAALLAAAAACGGSPSPDKQIETLQSWTATIHLTAAERRAGAISRAYARNLADAARDARNEASGALDAAPLPTPARAAVRRALDSLDLAVQQLTARNGAR